MEMPINYSVKSGLRPLYVDLNGHLWVGEANKLLISKDHGNTFQAVASYQKNTIDRIADFHRIFCRLFRGGLNAVFPLRDGGILGIGRKRVFRCEPGNSKLIPVFRITRGTRPLNICETPSGEIFFGEYFSNHNREAVNIFGSDDNGKTWTIVYTFPPGSVRHIHSIIYDEYRKGCWVFTGDLSEECKVLFTNNSFRNLETIISGNQRARTVSAIPIRRGLIIPTDTPLEKNVIQLFDPDRRKFEEIFKLPGSAFFTGQAGGHLLVSTAVEPSRVNPVSYAAIFISNDEGRTWCELYRQNKDIWPMKLFQHGALALPAGKGSDEVIYAYGQALKNVDGCMLKLKL